MMGLRTDWGAAQMHSSLSKASTAGAAVLVTSAHLGCTRTSCLKHGPYPPHSIAPLQPRVAQPPVRSVEKQAGPPPRRRCVQAPAGSSPRLPELPPGEGLSVTHLSPLPHTHLCTDTDVRIHTHIRTCAHTHRDTSIYTQAGAQTHIYTHLHTDTDMHIHTHTQPPIQTHIHTCNKDTPSHTCTNTPLHIGLHTSTHVFTQIHRHANSHRRTHSHIFTHV